MNFSYNHFRNNEHNNRKLYIIKNNNNINNQNISNGETKENEENKLKNNYDLIRKKLLLISKKEKRNINKEKNNSISQTSKNLYNFNNNIKEKKVKIKEYKDYKNKINTFEKRKNDKSKTFILKQFGQLAKTQKTFINSLNKKIEKNVDYENNNISKFRNRSKRNSFSNYSKTFNNNSINNNNNNKIKSSYHFPSLNISKIPKTERQDSINFSTNKKSLYNSFMSKVKESNNIIKKKYSLPKKALNLIDKNSQDINKNINNIKKSYFSKFKRNDINSKMNTYFNPNKILKSYKLYNKNNKFLKQLKQNIKKEYSNNFYSNLKKGKENEISLCLDFIENKINNWMTEIPSNKIDNEQKIVFNGEENNKNKKKEKKYMKIIMKDFIKTIFSTKDISYSYFLYHKGIIEKNILIFLQNKYFDFSVSSYIFKDKFNSLFLSKISKQLDKNIILKCKTIEKKKLKNIINNCNNKTPKFPRRFSSLEYIHNINNINNIVLPLNDTEKKSILYLYYLDIDLDSYNNNLENNEKNSFLKILRGNINNTETQDLLINKFISIFIKKSGTKNKFLSYNKKNSIKNNIIINKNSNESIKSNKLSLFKNNFFSRHEIKRSQSKVERIKKKKSLLEYNLLFDPNLTGYNNLITDNDKDIIFEPNTERTIIKKRKKEELKELKDKQLNIFFISSGGMKTDKNIIVMKTLDLKNQYNHKNKGNIKSLTSSIKDCNYDSFVKFYRACNCGPNAIDKDGNSLLSLAVKSSCLEIVEFLLEEKANPNLQNVSIFLKFILFL